MIRLADDTDRDLILEAQAASIQQEEGRFTWDELAEKMYLREIEFLVYTRGESVALIGCLYGKESASICYLLRPRGKPEHFLREMRILSRAMLERFDRRGVESVYVIVDALNPRAKSLLRLYRRLAGLEVTSYILSTGMDSFRKAVLNGSNSEHDHLALRR